MGAQNLVITLFVWLPLLLLSGFDGHALGGGLRRIRVACESVLFGFEDKWMEGALEISELLGAAEFQSLADLGNSYGMVREMRIVPFGLENVTRLAIAAATPLLPLVLTIFSIRQVADLLIKIAFR